MLKEGVFSDFGGHVFRLHVMSVLNAGKMTIGPVR
jgi:hypothetical protein